MASVFTSLLIYIIIFALIGSKISKKKNQNIQNQNKQQYGSNSRQYGTQQRTTGGNMRTGQNYGSPSMGRMGSRNQSADTVQSINEIMDLFKGAAVKGSNNKSTNRNAVNQSRYGIGEPMGVDFLKPEKKRQIFKPKEVDCELDERIFGSRYDKKDVF